MPTAYDIVDVFWLVATRGLEKNQQILAKILVLSLHVFLI